MFFVQGYDVTLVLFNAIYIEKPPLSMSISIYLPHVHKLK